MTTRPSKKLTAHAAWREVAVTIEMGGDSALNDREHEIWHCLRIAAELLGIDIDGPAATSATETRPPDGDAPDDKTAREHFEYRVRLSSPISAPRYFDLQAESAAAARWQMAVAPLQHWPGALPLEVKTPTGWHPVERVLFDAGGEVEEPRAEPETEGRPAEEPKITRAATPAGSVTIESLSDEDPTKIAREVRDCLLRAAYLRGIRIDFPDLERERPGQ